MGNFAFFLKLNPYGLDLNSERGWTLKKASSLKMKPPHFVELAIRPTPYHCFEHDGKKILISRDDLTRADNQALSKQLLNNYAKIKVSFIFQPLLWPDQFCLATKYEN